MDIALKMALCDFKGMYYYTAEQSSTQHSLKCSLCTLQQKTSKMKAIHKINIRAAGTEQMLQDMSNVLVYGGKQKNVYCCSLMIKSAVKCVENCLLDVRLFETTRRSYAWVDTPSCFHVKLSKNGIIKQCKIPQKICLPSWVNWKGKK